MKTFYLIGGTMGVGKTTVCRHLKSSLPNAVFLDGDWCWDADPFQVTEETKQMVVDNICFLLSSFVRCSAYENIIFCWVMHEHSIIDAILSGTELSGCCVKVISLLAEESTIEKGLARGVAAGARTADVLERSIAKLPLYQYIDSVKIYTDNKTVPEISAEILKA